MYNRIYPFCEKFGAAYNLEPKLVALDKISWVDYGTKKKSIDPSQDWQPLIADSGIRSCW